MTNNWDKAFILIDVSGGDRYWSLVDYLNKNGWDFTDAFFGEDEE